MVVVDVDVVEEAGGFVDDDGATVSAPALSELDPEQDAATTKAAMIVAGCRNRRSPVVAMGSIYGRFPNPSRSCRTVR